MWLSAPKELQSVLWEGALEPATDEAVARLYEKWPTLEVGSDASVVIHELPIVSIGRPEVWMLREFYTPGQMPASLRAKLEEGEFYLARLACSLRAGATTFK